MRLLVAYIINALANFALGLLVALFVGPAEFARFALAFSAGSILQLLAYEWLRLAAIRFHAAGAGQAGTRAHLDRLALRTGAALAGVAAPVGGLAWLLGLDGLTLALVPAVAAASGAFDYRVGILRAEFDDRAYARVITVKSVVSMVATVGLAAATRDAAPALAGIVLGAFAGVMVAGNRRGDGVQAGSGAPESGLFSYAWPLVAAGFCTLGGLFAARSLVVALHGWEVAGSFALALEFGVKAMMSIGSALDLLLFQFAVAAERDAGPEAARRRLSLNLAIVLAVLVPAVVGMGLIVPGIEAVFVAPAFRGRFAEFLLPLLPGLLAFGIWQYGLNAYFQVARNTRALLGVALLSLALVAILMSPLAMVAPAGVSVGLSIAFVATAGLLLWRIHRSGPLALPWSELARCVPGLCAMLGVALGARLLVAPGLGMVLLASVGGAAAYAIGLVACDAFGLRALVRARLGRLRAR